MAFFKRDKDSKMIILKKFQGGKWLFLLSLVIGFVTLFLIYQNLDVISVFRNFLYTSLPLFLLYLFISLLIQVFLVIRWKIIIKTNGYSVPFNKLWIYKTIGYGINYFTPAAHVGGEPMRAFMLKRYKVPFPKAISSVLIDKSMEISMNTFFALIGIFLIIMNYTLNTQAFYFIIILSGIFILFLLRGYYMLFKKAVFLNVIFDKLKNLKFMKRYLNEIISIKKEILSFYDTNRWEFQLSVLISLILWFLMFAEYKVALLMLGYNASIQELFLIITVVGFAYLIPIPAALGVLEVSQTSIFRFLKIDIGKGLALSFLIRSRDLLISLIGMTFLFYKSFKFKSMFYEKKSIFREKMKKMMN